MTIRQKRVAKLVENGRTMGEVMVQAGYSPNTAKAPTKLTKSKGWKELVEKHMPDEKLLKVHNELLASKQDQIRLGAVGLGYKVKGRMNDNTINIDKAIVIPILGGKTKE
jgi:hypothetical protein